MGEFWAVSVNDTLQGLLMIFTAILLPVVAIISVGGPRAFWHALTAASAADYLSFTGGDAGLLAVGMLTGRVLLGELDNPEKVFFSVNAALFPSVMGAILLAAVLSAIMSTADSMLLVAGTTVAHDLGINERSSMQALTISRLTIAAISIVAIAVAIFIPATIFQRVLFAWVAIGSALGPAIVCRAMGMKIESGRIFPAIGAGFLAAVVCYVLPDTPGDIVERSLPFILGLTILLLPSGRDSAGQ